LKRSLVGTAPIGASMPQSQRPLNFQIAWRFKRCYRSILVFGGPH
jgi:hypothetical protein